MGRQEGLITFSGKLDGAVGYARGKKNYIRSAPRTVKLSEESTKSGDEFGRGSTASALFRLAFAPILSKTFGSKLHNRLSERFRKVIRTGPLTLKGKRNVLDGDIQLLNGFEFSEFSRVEKLLSLSPEVDISIDSVNIRIPTFNWNEHISSSPKADCVIIRFICGFLDFEALSYHSVLTEDLIIKNGKSLPTASLSLTIPDLKEQVIAVGFSVCFATGNDNQKIQNRKYQAGSVLKTAHLRDGELVTFIPEPVSESGVLPEVKADVVGWDFG